MFVAFIEFARNVFQWFTHCVRNGAFDLSNASTWRAFVIRLLVPWILFNFLRINIVNLWYGLNFDKPWTGTDYPELGSNQTSSGRAAYPVLMNPASNIRLLHLLPSSDLWGLEATLETHSFLERPQYIALSYTWGDSASTKPITINGKRMDITENLWNALFHIRDSHKTQILWVDAICINQTNNEEKSAQVPLMSFIYSRAVEVVAWLGDHKGPRWVEQGGLSDFQGDWVVSKATDYWTVTKYWLYVLTQEEYWKRCWIVQELAMASRIRVLVGKSSIPWPDFIKLMKLYKTKVPLDGAAIDKVMRLESLREAKYVNSNAYTLDRLLENFGDCFCTVNLDKIFSFLGMASDCLDGCLSVDYSKSPLTVYQDLIKHWNSRCLRTGYDALGTARFAGLVRSILSRKPLRVPKIITPPGMTESTDSILYFICGDDRVEYCNLIPTFRSLLTWIDLINRLLERSVGLLFKWRTETKSLWPPSPPESIQMWTARNAAEFESNQQLVRVRGAITGIICDLGPMYQEFVEGSHVPARWATRLATIWGIACNATSMASARAINERLKMLLGPAADYRMRNFVSLNSDGPYSFHSSRLFIAFGPNREVIMGLTPWETLRGDLLVQFWDTDAVLVVRDTGIGKEPTLVGRAGIVKDEGIMAWDTPTLRENFEVPPELIFDHLVSLSVLTRLTLDTVCLPGVDLTSHDRWDTPKEPRTSQDFEMKDIEVFRDATIYDGAQKDDQIRHVDETNGDLLRECILEPCQLYYSRNTLRLSLNGQSN